MHDRVRHEVPKFVVAMPHYGDVSLWAGVAWASPVQSGQRDVDVVSWVEASTSITPSAFNEVWNVALDKRDAGEATHFAMIHSDVSPGCRGWLNVLYREMVEHGADVVSAVVPIKSHDAPRTSTAVGSGTDPWAVRYFIHVEDRDSLPMTFSIEDVKQNDDDVLLVNTGLWITDMRRPYWDDFFFQWHHRTSRRPDGSRRNDCRPEDWEMSRHVARHGGKVMATWAVPVNHHGPHAWKSHVLLPSEHKVEA